MRYALGEYEDACKDYGVAIRLAPEGKHAMLWYNRANAKARLGDFASALDDYDHAIRRGNVRHARFNKGNVLIMMGRFEDALECFLEEARIRDSERLRNNIAIMQGLLRRIADRKDTVSIFEQDSELTAGMALVTVFENQEQLSQHNIDPKATLRGPAVDRFYVCSGNSGNAGNFGGRGTDDGEGLQGENGFGLRIAWGEGKLGHR